MRDLTTMTHSELRQEAKAVQVKGWWNMKKSELIKAIEEKTTPIETPTKKHQKRLIEYKGKTQTLTAWARELGIRHQTLYGRIVLKGWDIEKAFETPTKSKGDDQHETAQN